ncbi:MAG: LacI family DNA-binding transcriptional regulator [Propionicimonas sp.]|nr:LacI family DNA-binding transcriptional regulator [Propionicimonas sp.]
MAVQPQPGLPAAPTLLDVAAAAGVSQATASRVLNGSTRKVAVAYRDRVLAAAEELGYTANLSAQATARGTSSVIALLVADIADPYFGQIASGVARGADEVGLVVTIAITERDHDREVRLVRTLRGLRPHALILAASRGSDPAPGLLQELEAFSSAGGRVVALGPGAGEARAVTVDNHGGAVALGGALAGIGYRRAVVLAASLGVHSSDDRVAGFTEGFTAGGGEVLRVHHAGYNRESGHRAMRAALAFGLEPGTLVFGVSDMVAVGAMAALREADRAVGPDIAVAGFDDTPTGRDVSPPLTTVHIPLEELGYQATRAAVDHDWRHVAAGLELDVVLRASTPPLG